MTCTIQREIEGTVCERCRGQGSYVYGSTATWQGGIGGAAMTSGVCDTCWGSGDSECPWLNLREVTAKQETEIARRASRFLADEIGASYAHLRPAIVEIADAVEALSRSRRKVPYFPNACLGLVRALRAMTEGEPQ